MRRAAILLALALATAAALPAPASAACTWSAKLRAPTHKPKAGAHWPIRVTTSLGKVRTSARYEFVFRGRVVAKRHINPKSDAPGKKLFHFRGSFRDPTVTWPRKSAGIPLTFRVVLRNKCGTKRLSYAVVVRK